MNGSKVKLSAAVLAACATLLAAAGADARQYPTSSGGARCVRFDGVSYDAGQQTYVARWQNICEGAVRVRFSRIDLRAGRIEGMAVIPGYGFGAAPLGESNAVLDWSEVP